MSKFKEAILEYEKKRQAASGLEKKRNSLISRCMKVDETDFHSKICLAMAYEEQRQMCKENNEYYSFSEVLEEGVCGGKYCQNCHDSYILKHGSLARARQEFGMAKRKLSALGKSIIKGQS